MPNATTERNQETCAHCGTRVRDCRCKGVELDGRCERPACRCWSELCCECGEEYARRFVGSLIC